MSTSPPSDGVGGRLASVGGRILGQVLPEPFLAEAGQGAVGMHLPDDPIDLVQERGVLRSGLVDRHRQVS